MWSERWSGAFSQILAYPSPEITRHTSDVRRFTSSPYSWSPIGHCPYPSVGGNDVKGCGNGQRMTVNLN
jgi:hypothetical protein